MPFKKITSGKNKGKYRHKTRVFTAKQVKLYYATDGFKNWKKLKRKRK